MVSVRRKRSDHAASDHDVPREAVERDHRQREPGRSERRHVERLARRDRGGVGVAGVAECQPGVGVGGEARRVRRRDEHTDRVT